MKDKPHKPIGAPPIPFRPEYCQMLIDHMRNGNSLIAFGAVVHVCKDTLYRWLEKYPEFLDARKKGEPFLHKFYEDMGKMIATGQLRRVVKEEPILNSQGEAVVDLATRKPLMRYEYAPANANSTAWIFLCKNLLNWRDKKDVTLAGDDEGGPIKVENLPDMELKAKIKELAVQIASQKND